MSVSLSVTLDASDMKRLAALPKKAEFAVVKSLTRTARDAQLALKAQAAGVFHLRNSWVPKGIQIEPATRGTMSAKVGSLDKYMARHVVGEDKPAGSALSIGSRRDSRGRYASGGLLIPVYKGIGSVGTHNVTKRRLARMESQKKKTFQIKAKGGSIMIVRRTSKKSKPLQFLAGLYNKAAEDRIWPFEVTVAKVVGARFGAHFEAAIADL